MPPGLGTPLLLGFFWVRWAGQRDQTVPVFLPGFKRDSRIDLSVVSPGVEAKGMTRLRSSVRHPQLGETEVSTGDAWISSTHRLVRVTFDAHGERGSAQGDIRLDGCEGEPPIR